MHVFPLLPNIECQIGQWTCVLSANEYQFPNYDSHSTMNWRECFRSHSDIVFGRLFLSVSNPGIGTNRRKIPASCGEGNSEKNSREIGMPTAAAEQSEAIKVIAQANLHNKKRNTMRPRENNKIRTQNLHKYLHNLVQMFRPEFPPRGRRGNGVNRTQPNTRTDTNTRNANIFSSNYSAATIYRIPKNSTTVRPCKTILRPRTAAKLFAVSFCSSDQKTITKFLVFDWTNFCFVASFRICIFDDSIPSELRLVAMIGADSHCRLPTLFLERRESASMTLSKRQKYLMEMLLTCSNDSATESLTGKHARSEWWHLSCTGPW